MKLKKSTLGLILIAASLTGFVYFHEIRGKEKLERIEEVEKLVFDFQVEDVEAIAITTDEETLKFERQKLEDSEDLIWQITEPEEKKADEATVEFLLSKMASLKSDRSLTTSASNLAQYGLETPANIVEVQLQNGENYRLLLGEQDFSQSFIYANLEVAEAETENVSILLIPLNFQNIIAKPISEWESKEEIETEASEEIEDESQ
ncbi:MAG: DUF4340 domain-containing protein [Okeania sp. SIO2H7]|nr:DUF4340 domain-containing protein [Okeania sp. SIO2H7]